VCAYAIADHVYVIHTSDMLYALSGGGWLVLARAAVIRIMSVSLLSVIINTV